GRANHNLQGFLTPSLSFRSRQSRNSNTNCPHETSAWIATAMMATPPSVTMTWPSRFANRLTSQGNIDCISPARLLPFCLPLSGNATVATDKLLPRLPRTQNMTPRAIGLGLALGFSALLYLAIRAESGPRPAPPISRQLCLFITPGCQP